MAYGTNGPRWANPTTPYEINENNFPVGSPEHDAIDRAINEWNNNTVIRLIPWAGENDLLVFGDAGTKYLYSCFP